MTALTNAQIDRMTAEKVMGWHKTPTPFLAWIDENGSQHYWVKDWHPGEIEHLNQAWEVMDAVLKTDSEMAFELFHLIAEARDTNPSRAICLAALQVVEGK